MTLSEYSRPNRAAYNGQANTPVKVSFIHLNDSNPGPSGERICFNVGRELYFYSYKGVKKAADLTKPIDKRVYKGTFPTCHDFNALTATAESVMLLVGFTAGQIQLINPITKEIGKLYNEDRLIDKTKVTCIKWIPGSPNQFLVSHSSGQLYVYNEGLECTATPPHYQPFKQGDGFVVSTCKTKSTRNPLYRWVIGEGAINEFSFSPCSKYLAVVSQDGYLRVFNYNSMELVGFTRSYFGGLLCVSWSQDGKFISVGGEDDLLTVWSFHEKRVICRGQGHKSWVNAVTFDPHTSIMNDCDVVADGMVNDEEFSGHSHNSHDSVKSNGSTKTGTATTTATSNRPPKEEKCFTSYRIGSVGQDTLMCLWDLTEDIIRQPFGAARSRTSFVGPTTTLSLPVRCNSLPHTHINSSVPKELTMNSDGNAHPPPVSNSTSFTQKFATLAIGDRKDREEKREHKRNFSLASKSGADKSSLLRGNHVKDDALRLLGTTSCPRLNEVPLLEPLVCKKIAHERLTALVFREDCLVTASQEGFVCTWGRPGKMGLTQQHSSVTPSSSIRAGTVV